MTATEIEHTTEDVLRSMLVENTGRSFLDSGDYYGRNYERNQKVNPADVPSAWMRAYVSQGRPDIVITVNVYDFLAQRVEYAQVEDELFHGDFLAEVDQDNDLNWMELMERFPAWLDRRMDGTGHEYGPYWADGGAYTFNSYNGEDYLSQVIQFTAFSVHYEGHLEELVALQIHGGADVRGGYTKPRIFRPSGTYGDTAALLDVAEANVGCSRCQARWFVQANHWEGDNSYRPEFEDVEGIDRLDKMPAIDVVDIIDEQGEDAWPWQIPDLPNPAETMFPKEIRDANSQIDLFKLYPWRGTVVIEDSHPHCPACGGILEVYP